MSAIKEQDPNATLDYIIDWTAWLNGDTISTSNWAMHPDLTATNASNTTTSATVFISGGTAGKTYKVRNRITTANGRGDDETFDLLIRDH